MIQPLRLLSFEKQKSYGYFTVITPIIVIIKISLLSRLSRHLNRTLRTNVHNYTCRKKYVKKETNSYYILSFADTLFDAR